LRKISEERTRKEMIDPQLEKAGWYLRDHSKVKTEIPVDGYDAEPWNGVSDYCLYRENGEVLAVVEAKKATVDVRLAQAQLEYYVKEIEKHQSFRPFGFLANGVDSLRCVICGRVHLMESEIYRCDECGKAFCRDKVAHGEKNSISSQGRFSSAFASSSSRISYGGEKCGIVYEVIVNGKKKPKVYLCSQHVETQ